MLVVGSAMYRRPLAETLTSVPFPSSNEMNDRRCLLRAWQREVARHGNSWGQVRKILIHQH